ncbi:hypothetical protein BCR44DRAFT_1375328, partial [Catenaria anguillulae PL171]
FAVTLALAPGIYRFKFIVDDEWRCAPKLPTAQDEDGNLVNFVEVGATVPSPSRQTRSPLGHAQPLLPGGSHPASATSSGPAAVPEHVRSQPVPAFSSSVPTPSSSSARATPIPTSAAAAISSLAASSAGLSESPPDSLPVPPHVSLNHLYACSIKDGVMAVAVTGRYRKK